MRRIRLKYESASVDLVVWEDEENRISLSNLFSKTRNQGHATQLMTQLCEHADRYGETLILVAKRFGHPIGPDNAYLREFYQQFGFRVTDDSEPTIMERMPSQELHGL